MKVVIKMIVKRVWFTNLLKNQLSIKQITHPKETMKLSCIQFKSQQSSMNSDSCYHQRLHCQLIYHLHHQDITHLDSNNHRYLQPITNRESLREMREGLMYILNSGLNQFKMRKILFSF